MALETQNGNTVESAANNEPGRIACFLSVCVCQAGSAFELLLHIVFASAGKKGSDEGFFSADLDRGQQVRDRGYTLHRITSQL